MKQSKFSIRPANTADVPPIHTIYHHYVHQSIASWELVPPSPAEIQSRMNALKQQGYPYLVAEVKGVVLGYAYASPFRAREGYRYTVENSVYVHPEHQRCGLGSGLLTHLIEACADCGYHQMVAVIGDATNTATIRLHQKLGFVLIGTLSNIGFKHGRWLDCLLMQRSLAIHRV